MSPQQVPLLKPALAGMLGIICAVFIPVFTPMNLLGLLACLYICLSFLRSYRYAAFRSSLWFVASFLLFAVLTQHSFHGLYPSLKPLSKKNYQIQLEKVERKAHYYKAIGRIQHIEKPNAVVLNIKRDSVENIKLQAGATLIANVGFYPISKPQYPQQFDYAKYMAYRGVYYQGFVPQSEIRVIQAAKGFKSAFEEIREQIIKKYQAVGIVGPELGVLAALTIGEKSELQEETKLAFTQSGTVHVLAVSGLHVGIIYLVLLTVFLQRRRKKTSGLVLLLVLLLLWSYAVLSGWSPSVRRATTMFSFLACSTLLQRQAHPLNYLAASALLLMLLNPLVIFEVGFQMSYLAVSGILFLYPLIYHRWVIRNRFLNLIWQMLSVSLAAQLATTPLSLYYFGQFPVYFLLANLIVIPLVTCIVWGGVILNLLLLFSFQLATYFAKILQALCLAVNSCTSFIAKLPNAVIIDIQIGLISMLLSYALIMLYYRQAYQRKRSTRLIIIAIWILLLTIPSPYVKEEGVLMYQAYGKLAIVNCQDKRVFLSGGYDTHKARSYLRVLQPRFHDYRYEYLSQVSNQIMSYGNTPILNLNSLEGFQKMGNKSPVLMLQSPIWDVGCLNEIKPDAIILAGTCHQGYARWLRNRGLDIDIDLHFPNKNGGLVFH